jgi:hypothetical protein
MWRIDGVKAVLLKFFGAHAEYDRIDARSVDHTGAQYVVCMIFCVKSAACR